MAAHHDHWQNDVATSQFRQQRQPIDARHADIDKNTSSRQVAIGRQQSRRILVKMHFVTCGLQLSAESSKEHGIIVDNVNCIATQLRLLSVPRSPRPRQAPR
jgi:hypothetical protein